MAKVVGLAHEGLGCCSAVDRLQHRSLHFKVIPLINHKTPDKVNYARPLYYLLPSIIDYEVQVPLSEASIDVCKSRRAVRYHM
eukprot:XP_001707386.1 Hypothetical protein GL50803_100635 [Giardia lamblia ATCC 50803]